LKRKIAAILAADVAGYSRLMAEDEEETTRRLMSYRAVFDDFISRADGRIVDTAGDSVLAEFPSAVDALRAAIDIQESLRTRNLGYPPSRHMVFRMGLTIGDVIEREGDLLGDGVNVAARLEALAPPGGICVSRSVHEQVANKLSVIFSDLGPQEVKNIPRPIHVYRVELEKGAAPAEVSTTLSLDGQSKEKQWRSVVSTDGVDVPLAHARTRSFGKMGALIAASIMFLAAACGVGWLWISSAQQPATTLPLSEVDLLKFLEPYVNKDGRAYHAREYAKTEIHRSLVLAPVAKVAVSTGGWSSRELAAEKNVERCSQYFNEACAIIGMDDDVFVPRAGEGWPLKDAPRVHYSGIFNPERIPTLRERELLRPDIAAYATLSGPKAAAFHALGILVLKTNAPDQRSAEASALAECNANPARSPKTLGGPCYLYAVGNQVVLPLRSTMPMTAAAPKDQSPPASQQVDPRKFREDLASLIVTVSPAYSDAVRQQEVGRYSAAHLHKAMAIQPDRGSYFLDGYASVETAKQSTLEACQIHHGLPCLLLAVDDKLQEKPPTGGWPVLSMERVIYAGVFDPQQIPVLVDSNRNKPDVQAYRTISGPKAAAIHPWGRLFIASGTSSQKAAEEKALADCTNDPSRGGRGGPCWLYAIGNDVVLYRRSTAPITAAP
jgi:class 3 adenylate cyclase